MLVNGDASANRRPAHNHAEQSVLGSILLSDRLLPAVVLEVGLSPADFYRERYRVVFAAMLHQADEPIDHLTVSEQLQRQGQLEEVGGVARSRSWLAGCPPPGTGSSTPGSCSSSPSCVSC